MRVTVRTFAAARDAFGFDTKEMVVQGSSLADLRESLAKTFPAARDVLRSCRLAVNLEYAGDGAPIKEGDQVAIIPPVSGG